MLEYNGMYAHKIHYQVVTVVPKRNVVTVAWVVVNNNIHFTGIGLGKDKRNISISSDLSSVVEVPVIKSMGDFNIIGGSSSNAIQWLHHKV